MNDHNESIYVYLIARVSEKHLAWNDTMCEFFDQGPFEVFKPQDALPPEGYSHKQFPRTVFETCEEAMIKADVGLLLAPYGRDCAWECGWFYASGKPVVAFVQNWTGWLRDWMVKGGLHTVITDNEDLCLELSEDPVLVDGPTELVLIESIKELPDIIEFIVDLEYRRDVIEIE